MTDLEDPPDRFVILPPECKFPGCEETARSAWSPHCSGDHERACLLAAAEIMGSAESLEELADGYEELCEEKLESIEQASEKGLGPEEMQRRIDSVGRASDSPSEVSNDHAIGEYRDTLEIIKRPAERGPGPEEMQQRINEFRQR